MNPRLATCATPRERPPDVVAVLVVVFNLFGLPYAGLYDNFLILVSFVFNALIVWNAWTWVSTAA
jgi:hypothetical protein